MADRLAIFNHPQWSANGELTSADPFLNDQLIALFAQAEAGSQIRIAIAGWEVAAGQLHIDRLLLELKGALSRGCDVKIIGPALRPAGSSFADPLGWYELGASSTLVTELARTLGGNVRFWPSEQAACGAISHSKFVLFSQLRSGGAPVKWVLADMSAQWRASELARPNDMLVFAEERGLYLSFLRYWQALWMGALGTAAAATSRFHPVYETPDLATRAYFQPHPDQTEDPIVALLGTLLITSETRIYVAMAAWGYSGRGKALLDRLLSLSAAGCDVRIIAHHHRDSTAEESALRCSVDPGQGASVGECETSQVVWEKIAAQGKIRWAKSAVHSKYILVDGPIIGEGGESHRMVIVAAQSFRNGGVDPVIKDGCEPAGHVLVLRDDQEIYKRYLDNWSWLCAGSWSTSSLSPCGD